MHRTEIKLYTCCCPRSTVRSYRRLRLNTLGLKSLRRGQYLKFEISVSLEGHKPSMKRRIHRLTKILPASGHELCFIRMGKEGSGKILCKANYTCLDNGLYTGSKENKYFAV